METPTFIDGLGRRMPAVGSQGEPLEIFRLCAEIPPTPAMEAALVERAISLAHFQHPLFARVLRIDRHGGERGALAVVSAAVPGLRWSDLLRQSERSMAERDLDAAIHVLQQAVRLVAALHAHASDASHGAIGPERLVVRADGSVVLVEHVLGSVLEALELSRSQLWTLFRVPVPPAASAVRFDQQTDVLQLGVLALALLLGRVLTREEFPQGLPKVLEEAAVPDACRNFPGLPRSMRSWIARALLFEPRTSFRSAIEAERALAEAVKESRSCRPSPAAVQRFLASCSFEALVSPAASSSPRPASGGAVVIVGMPSPAAHRALTGAAMLDRGSGAHRVARQREAFGRERPEVLADLAGEAASAAIDDLGDVELAAALQDAAGGDRPRTWLARLRDALLI
jgi:hypothetical protein